MNMQHAVYRPVAFGLVVAAAFTGAALLLRALTPEHISIEVGQRLFGILCGLLVIAYANVVPKTLVPLVRLRGDPAREQALRRFAGWSLLLGGLVYALAWLLAPLQYARAIAIAGLGTATLLVVLRCLWAGRGAWGRAQ